MSPIRWFITENWLRKATPPIQEGDQFFPWRADSWPKRVFEGDGSSNLDPMRTQHQPSHAYIFEHCAYSTKARDDLLSHTLTSVDLSALKRPEASVLINIKGKPMKLKAKTITFYFLCWNKEKWFWRRRGGRNFILIILIIFYHHQSSFSLLTTANYQLILIYVSNGLLASEFLGQWRMRRLPPSPLSAHGITSISQQA